MLRIITDEQKAIRAFNGYFKAWPNLYAVDLTLLYNQNFYYYHPNSESNRFDEVHTHLNRLVGLLDTTSYIVGHFIKQTGDLTERLAIRCILFLKYESFLDTKYCIHEIGSEAWTYTITGGQGTYTFYDSDNQQSALSNVRGLISKADRSKRKHVVKWINEFLQPVKATYGHQNNSICKQLTYIKTLAEPIRRIEPTPYPLEIPPIALKNLLTQKELNVMWSAKKQCISNDALKQIAEAKIIYKELLSHERVLDVSAMVSMLPKIETVVNAIRYYRLMAFDRLNNSTSFPPHKLITVLGKQLLDLYEFHLKDSSSKIPYALSVTQNFSYSVQAFFKIWEQVKADYPMPYGGWPDESCVIIFNQFVLRLKRYLLNKPAKPIFEPFRSLSIPFRASRLKLLPVLLPSIHQRINSEEMSASKTFDKASEYINTLFKRNVVLVALDFIIENKTDSSLSNEMKAKIFTEFMRYAANTVPLNYSLGYIGQWRFDQQGQAYPHVIFFLDGNQVSNVDEVHLAIALDWGKFLGNTVSTNKKLMLESKTVEGHLEKSIVFETLPDFKSGYCRVNISDRKMQKLFIEQVVLYLCKSRLYDKKYADTFKKGLIKGTLKTANVNIMPKTTRSRVEPDSPQKSNLWLKKTHKTSRDLEKAIDELDKQENHSEHIDKDDE